MTDEQRTFLAVGLCMAISLGWLALRPVPVAEVASPTPAAPAAPAAPAIAPTAAAVEVARHVETPPSVPVATRPFLTDRLAGTLSNRPLALTELTLRDYHEGAAQAEPPAPPLSLVPEAPGVPGAPGDAAVGQAEILWDLGARTVPQLAFVEAAAGSPLVLAGAAHEVALRVEVKPQADTYGFDYLLSAANQGSQVLPVGASVVLALPAGEAAQSGPFGLGGSAGTTVTGICSVDGSLSRKDAGELASASWQVGAGAQWVALDRQYFVVGMVPDGGEPGACAMQRDGDVVRVRFTYPPGSLAPGERWQRRFRLYTGPKRTSDLQAVAPPLADVVDYTLLKIPLSFLALPMLSLLGVFYRWTASWGVAIVLLTLVVKLLLFPVTYRSVISMRRMQQLKPELDKIKERFAKDRERQQIEQANLMKARGVNPLSGCLPILLQMPVWAALYRTLSNAVDLYHQPFLWLPDLTSKEPWPVLAVSVGILTLVQQRMTPMPADNPQAKTMGYIMPFVVTLFMVALPSGLVVYTAANSVLTLVQQVVINRRAEAS